MFNMSVYYVVYTTIQKVTFTQQECIKLIKSDRTDFYIVTKKYIRKLKNKKVFNTLQYLSPPPPPSKKKEAAQLFLTLVW